MSMLRAYGTAFVSLLAGASVVHYIYRPDLTIPDVSRDSVKVESTTAENISTLQPSPPPAKPLAQLAQSARALLQTQDYAAAPEDEALDAELLELRREHSRLCAELRELEQGRRSGTHLEKQFADAEKSSKAAAMQTATTDTGKLSVLAQQTEGRIRLRQLEAIDRAYRLAGKTVLQLDRNRIGVRFDTFYDGRFYESFYVILQCDEAEDRCHVAEHTIPYFLPLRDAEKEHLVRKGSVRDFVECVADFVHAFVGRRQQLDKTLQLYRAQLQEFYHSQSCTLVEFVAMMDDNIRVGVRLVYDDLASSMPTRATVGAWVAAPSQACKVRAAEEELKAHPLPVAFELMLAHAAQAMEALT
eukprot:jgi/Chlat1/9233/Chrsp99S08516